jgi:nucleotidyltransferase/DNA polymerase involved in DNA repair/outer membrane murein-binding lipoprotein Lpp
MQLTDVRIDRFGPLANTAVENLSEKMTVFFGPVGSGKSAFVQFVRELFHGYRRNTTLTSSERTLGSGSARVLTENGPRTLRRWWTVAGPENFSVSDENERLVGIRQDNHLPEWVSDDVFQEIFSPGRDEADRFDLLIRLCIESGVAGGTSVTELRQAEAALTQAVRDRDGNGIHGGVVHHISELRRRQGKLQGEISQLRKPSSDLAARVEQLSREIEGLTVSIDRTDAKIREIDAEILRLEQLLITLRQRHVLALNRPQLENEIVAVSARLDAWRGIRTQIAREVDSLPTAGQTVLHADDSVRSIRAIISRLEERAQTLSDRQRINGLNETESAQYSDVVRQLRGEVAALCKYFGQHEQSATRQAECLQSLTAQRGLADATQMERLLEEQLRTLRTELARAENVLAETAIPKFTDACRFSGHHDSSTYLLTGTSEHLSVLEIETRIQSLKAERHTLLSERAGLEDSVSGKRLLLDRLRQELAGGSNLEQLDNLRAQIAELDAEVSLLEDQRRQLDRTELSLREVIERLKGRSHSRVFELASQYIQRLTEGEYQQITAMLPDRLLLHQARHAEPQTLAQLTHGVRDQVALALRLALIQTRAPMQGRVPMIIDDVFVSPDDMRAIQSVRLLVEVARQGQQIVLFTSSSKVRDLFAQHDADVRFFSVPVEVPVPIPVAPAPAPLHAYIEPRSEVKLPVVEPIVYLQPPAPPVVAESDATATNWLFYLEVDHGVEDLAGITLGELEALRSAGIMTIDDMLTRTVPQIESATRLKGFRLPVDRIQALRGQAEMTTRVPMLRRGDAALLFASGIHSVEELSKLRPETVYDRVSEFQRSEAGGRFRRGGRLIDRQQAINWARFGQFTRTLDDARHTRSRFAVRPAPRSLAPVAAAAVTSGTVKKADPAKRLRRRRVAEDLNTEDRRARREARRQRQVSRLRTNPVDAATDESAPAERIGGMRFFLSRTSEVEKAPSIGPRTAEMMEAIGIRTVEDLLSITPDRLAEKLSHRRITTWIIQQWQAQSRLMCQIPELRGHDAQILVACHIITPESLAVQKPAELFAVVEPFSRTKEGERIIRTGRKPDLAEVTEWIQWAANARSLRAA